MTQPFAWVPWVLAALFGVANIIQFIKSRRQGVSVEAETGANMRIYTPMDYARPGPRTPSTSIVARRRPTVSEQEQKTTVRIYISASSTVLIIEAAIITTRQPLLRRRATSLVEAIRQTETVLPDGKRKCLVLTEKEAGCLGEGPLWARVRTERGHYYYAPLKRLTGDEL
ncbi:hypothetical protein AB0K52_06645 [Glycomyces sp. NPDC049804]|uniref:hypothetical protein n=1 Tax=Glycomyces sp. NPDC049804 TaxID=3154363 RepID=UPI003418AF5E